MTRSPIWLTLPPNARLGQRVAEKHEELARNYPRMQARERLPGHCRGRSGIIHDGIGAHLISALSLVEHGNAAATELAAVLRECLDDLQLTIDSLEPTENDLLPVMGNPRYRLTTACATRASISAGR
jgi:hypothetical protein